MCLCMDAKRGKNKINIIHKGIECRLTMATAHRRRNQEKGRRAQRRPISPPQTQGRRQKRQAWATAEGEGEVPAEGAQDGGGKATMMSEGASPRGR